jgi:hypothetical protein
MSEKNLPDHEPTPTLGGGADPVGTPEAPREAGTGATAYPAADGSTAPGTDHTTDHATVVDTTDRDLTDGNDATPPPTPPTSPYGEVPPPPPERKSRKGLLIGLVAAVVVLVLVAGAIGAVLLLKGNDSHTISTPATAGSMKRDTTQEKQLGQQLTQAEEQFKTQGDAAKISYVKSAVYKQDKTSRGPAGGLVFLGAKLKKMQKAEFPKTWVSDVFTKQAKANGLKVVNVSAGEGKAKAACASIATPQKVAICAWATKDSIGELVPTVAGYDSATLAKIMRDLRTDVETTD